LKQGFVVQSVQGGPWAARRGWEHSSGHLEETERRCPQSHWILRGNGRQNDCGRVESRPSMRPARDSDDCRSSAGDALPSKRNLAGDRGLSINTLRIGKSSGHLCTSSITTKPRSSPGKLLRFGAPHRSASPRTLACHNHSVDVSSSCPILQRSMAKNNVATTESFTPTDYKRFFTP